MIPLLLAVASSSQESPKLLPGIQTMVPKTETLWQAGRRTYAEHDEIAKDIKVPFVLDIERKSGGLRMVGVRHTSDGKDPQLPVITKMLDDWKPDLVLVEGHLGIHRGTEETVISYGESAYVAFQARKRSIEVASWDPERRVLGQELLKHMDAETILVATTLRILAGNPDRFLSDEKELNRLLSRRASTYGLVATIRNAAELDRVWTRFKGVREDWRDVRAEDIWPRDEGHALNSFARIESNLRDEHMVNVLGDELGAGKRVLVVAGFSHVVCLEPVLEATFSSE